MTSFAGNPLGNVEVLLPICRIEGVAGQTTILLKGVASPSLCAIAWELSS